MKIFKKILCFCVLSCLTLGIGFGAWMLLPDDKSSAAVISEETFEYITLSRYRQKLDESNLKTIDETTYVIANDSITMTFKPMEYAYEFAAIDESKFIVDATTITQTYDPTISNSFEFDGETYYYIINPGTGVLNIYRDLSTGAPPIATSNRNNAITFSQPTPDSPVTIKILKSITLKDDAPNVDFAFSVNAMSTIKTYIISFLRPVVRFADASEHIVRFTCNGIDAGTDGLVDNIIPNEKDYNSVQLDFLNNSYTEANPLYFAINYNGFVYTFELYSKEFNSVDYLFVNYIDEVKEDNNQYLATRLILNQSLEYEVDTSNAIHALTGGTNINEFSFVFTETGRYSIEIYDSTYLYGFENPNYMQQSFYITDGAKSNFENIYIIAQTLDEEGKELEYIVSTSNVNNDVKTTIKNLNDFAKEGGQDVTLADVIDRIEVIKTTFGGSTNDPKTTTYLPEDIEPKLNDEGDLIFTFDSDAYYQMFIYQKGTEEIIYYDFIIVKHAKTTFTVPLVDENGEPIYDPVTGLQKTDTYEATVPFKTEIIEYTKNILSSLNVKTKFKSSGATEIPKTLGKTYTNEYTISYGVQSVSMEQFDLVKEDGGEKVSVPGLHLKVFGVGDITLSVTFNGVTTDYILNSEEGNNTISFTEYGTYTVRLVDSMGTQTSGVYKYAKKLNTSAIALIILSAIIVLAIVAFIMISRGKVKTR